MLSACRKAQGHMPTVDVSGVRAVHDALDVQTVRQCK